MLNQCPRAELERAEAFAADMLESIAAAIRRPNEWVPLATAEMSESMAEVMELQTALSGKRLLLNLDVRRRGRRIELRSARSC